MKKDAHIDGEPFELFPGPASTKIAPTVAVYPSGRTTPISAATSTGRRNGFPAK